MSEHEIARRDDAKALDLTQPADLAAVFVKSGYWQDVRTGSQGMVKVLAGRELGLGAFASMQGIDIVEGHLRLRSVILASMVKRSEFYDYRVRDWSDTGCKIEFLQKEGDGWESLGFGEFNDADRERAGLSLKTRKGFDSVWGKHPRAMYFARALSQGVNAHCPDMNHGIRVYTEGDFPDEVVNRHIPDVSKTDDLNAALEDEPEDLGATQTVEVEVVEETPDVPADVSEQDIPGLT